MKNIVSWVGASAIGMILAGACTVTVNDDTDAGGTGVGGSSGSGGTAGTGGTAGSGGTGGTSTLDAGSMDQSVETGPVQACQICATQHCGSELAACRADSNGCAPEIGAFFSCLASSDFDTCASNFTIGAFGSDAGQSLANDFATCVGEDNDSGTRCSDLCAIDGG